MTISSVSSTNVSSAPTAASTGISPTRAAGLASTAVSLSGDAGVIAFLGGATPTANSASQLYTNLANAGVGLNTQTAATAASSADPTSADGGTGTPTTATAAATASSADPTSASNLNADWSTILQANPGLAPLVEQLNVQQSLVDTFA